MGGRVKGGGGTLAPNVMIRLIVADNLLALSARDDVSIPYGLVCEPTVYPYMTVVLVLLLVYNTPSGMKC